MRLVTKVSPTVSEIQPFWVLWHRFWRFFDNIYSNSQRSSHLRIQHQCILRIWWGFQRTNSQKASLRSYLFRVFYQGSNEPLRQSHWFIRRSHDPKVHRNEPLVTYLRRLDEMFGWNRWFSILGLELSVQLL